MHILFWYYAVPFRDLSILNAFCRIIRSSSIVTSSTLFDSFLSISSDELTHSYFIGNGGESTAGLVTCAKSASNRLLIHDTHEINRLSRRIVEPH